MRALFNYNNCIKTIEEFESIYTLIAPKHWMLVCDNSFQYLSDDIKKIYDNHKDNCLLFNDFSSNPRFESVIKGLNMFCSCHCSLIVAIGGGSTIDVAKCIKLFSGAEDPFSYLSYKTGLDYAKINDINFIALPTTAGTGSESTKHAVIYYNGQKQSIEDNAIIPDIAIIEPIVLKTLPITQKKATMLDALCQAIESWWSVKSDENSKKYSKIAVDIIVANYKAYIYENDEKAAEKIMYAANCAGRAINITQTTAAHAMSYKITSLYNLSHGHAVAVCLPEVWEYMLHHISDCVDNRGQNYLQDIFNEIPVDVSWFKALMAELQMENPVASDRNKEIEMLADSVNAERLKNNPIYLSREVLRNLYERIVK